MRLRRTVPAIVTAVLLLPASQLIGQNRKGPVINDQFPIKSGDELSSPIVSPVGECAQAVHVSGFIAEAIVRVYVNGATIPAGTQQPVFAEADITLSAPLNLGDKVTATQEVLGLTSAPSVDPMVVGAYPANLNRPVTGPDLFGCGKIVPVDKLNPGTTVNVFQNGGTTPIGTANATQAWQPVFTQSLIANDKVTAQQIACPAIPGKLIKSPVSAAVTVQKGPSPPPAPTLDPYPVGATVVVAHDLYVGAEVEVDDHGSAAGGGYANASSNSVSLSTSATSTSSISVSQKLCTQGPSSTPQPPTTTLKTPVIVPPVCEGTHYITVQGTYPNAVVVLYRNGTIAGMAGGVLGDLKMTLGSGAAWALGDEIQVVEYVGGIVSQKTAVVFADCAAQNVLTQHNNNGRTGINANETTLNPSNVNQKQFGKLFSYTLDDQTYSQPLYAFNLTMSADRKVHNVVFVTTV